MLIESCLMQGLLQEPGPPKKSFFIDVYIHFFLFLFLLYVRFLRILFVDVRLMYLIAFLVAF